MQEIYYPAKKNLIKRTLEMINSGETPTKDFLETNKAIFSQFPNACVRKTGSIHTILELLPDWLKYGEAFSQKSREGLRRICSESLTKHEPKTKVVRDNVKKVLVTALAEEKAPDESVLQLIRNDIKKASESTSKPSYSQVCSAMTKTLKFLENWSKQKESGEKRSITEKGKEMAENLMKDLFQQLPLGCWNLNNSDQSTQFSIQISSDTSNPMMNNNILERILEKASTKQLKRILDVTKEKQDRFLSVAKIVDVNEKVLTRLGVISGLSKSDAEMRLEKRRILG